MNSSSKRILNEIKYLENNGVYIINFDLKLREINIFYNNKFIDIFYYNSYPFSNINKISINNEDYSEILRKKSNLLFKNSKIVNNKKILNDLNLKFKNCCLYCSSYVCPDNWSPIVKLYDYLIEIKNIFQFEKNYSDFLKIKILKNILYGDLINKIESFLNIKNFDNIFNEYT